MDPRDLIVLTPSGSADPSLAIAACRAGARGVLDLEFAPSGPRAALERLARFAGPGFGVQVRVDAGDVFELLAQFRPACVILAGADHPDLPARIRGLKSAGAEVLREAVSVAEAARAVELGADGVILKGYEAGGRVGTDTSFVLLQKWRQYADRHAIEVPFWVRGGVGANTAAACAAGGARGVVLDAQVLLTRETPLGDSARKRIAGLDGSETLVLGSRIGEGYRIYARPDCAAAQELAKEDERLQNAPIPAEEKLTAWRKAVRERVAADPAQGVWLAGQDVVTAVPLAAKGLTVAGVVQNLCGRVGKQLESAAKLNHLAPDSPLAKSHGTKYPVLQGPMTRVSDTAAFAESVATGGALPFLALALLRKAETEKLLAETKAKVGKKPWGVGILGFVPNEIRSEQLEAIRTHKPPFAIIAGGRPDQARELESQGIATYLHVPSPGLLKMFLKDGSRRFIFEGQECGGHIGPRASFALWEAMVEVLLDHIGGRPADDLHVVFAGGIHDALSARMVAALSAPLAEKGAKVGILIGTAYLFTREAVKAGAITEREFRQQLLDDMDLERERGITIKASAVTVFHEHKGERFMLNFIDTPGHVDFHYEVRKALQACEGAILVVDATQGVQAQTVANAYAALEQNLEIIPVVNKIDLPSAQPETVADEIEQVLGFPAEKCIFISAKSGQGIDDLVAALCEKLPPPKGAADGPARGLIFDSHYDDYRGVVVYVRMVDGRLEKGEKVQLMGTGRDYLVSDLGKFMPRPTRVEEIGPGEVGYVVAAIKDIHDVRIGDTVTGSRQPAPAPLPGYEPVQQMVFCDFYPGGSTQYEALRDAMDRLSLNDSSFSFVPESSDALGFGFRCGFLGLLHMEIVQERLEREFGVEVVQTAPTVTYEILKTDGTVLRIDAPSQLPDPSHIVEVREPFIKMDVIVPGDAVGAIMKLCEDRRGTYRKTEYIGAERVILTYDIPLAEVIYDFYDKLKGSTRGYGTMDYDLTGFRAGNLVRVDVLVNGNKVDALSMILHRTVAEQRSRKILTKLKEQIDRHLFEIPLQAAIGGKVIARETIKSVGKNVTAKCYGGDISRKRKLLEKQGKKRMKRVGQVDIPQEAFLAVLEAGD